MERHRQAWSTLRITQFALCVSSFLCHYYMGTRESEVFSKHGYMTMAAVLVPIVRNIVPQPFLRHAPTFAAQAPQPPTTTTVMLSHRLAATSLSYFPSCKVADGATVLAPRNPHLAIAFRLGGLAAENSSFPQVPSGCPASQAALRRLPSEPLRWIN